MARTARITSIKDALTQLTIAVPVIFRDGVGRISEGVPPTLGGNDVPRTLTKVWCARQGLKDDPGSSIVLRSLQGPNVAFVSLGESDQDTNAYRLAGGIPAPQSARERDRRAARGGRTRQRRRMVRGQDQRRALGWTTWRWSRLRSTDAAGLRDLRPPTGRRDSPRRTRWQGRDL